MDYRVYHMNLLEELEVFLVSFIIAVAIAQLFYDSWAGIILLIPIWYFLRPMARDMWQKKRIRMLSNQFQDAMQSVSTSLLAGYSLENAWQEAEREMRQLHGEDACITREWHLINQAVQLHTPIEQSFQEFAVATGVEDILLFAEVFSFAKRSGGNLVHVISNTTDQMKEKRDVEEEIQIMVASKKLEQRIMDVIPMGMLVYLKVASPDYLSLLYHNAFGILFMTVCLAAYVAIIWFSQRILEIRI